MSTAVKTAAEQTTTIKAQGNGAATVDPKSLIASVNETLANASTAAVRDVQPVQPSEPTFKVGWDLATFARKNGLNPASEITAGLHKTLSREATKAQLERMSALTRGGMKTTVKRSAVWNQKSKCWDTALTARVVEPDCDDGELIETAYVKAQARQAKLLSNMRAAAIDQGANIEDENIE